MAKKQIQHTISPATFLYRFAVLFSPLLLLFLTITFFIYHLESVNHLELIANKEKVVVSTGLQLIHNTIDPIQEDIGFLSNICSNNLLKTQNVQESQVVIRRLETIFLSFAENHPVYDQIRFLDQSGMERIRINFYKDKPVIVQSELMQNKGERYYFRDTIQLKKGEVFISPLDLNIEYHEIETPLKPMIRLGQVVVDKEENKLGAVILNYKAREMLDKIHDWSITQPGDLMLLNSDGYWLHGKQYNQEWGFIFPERRSFCLKTMHPNLWTKSINRAEFGQVKTGEGLFTFATVRPLRKGDVSSTGSASATGKSSRLLSGDDYYWKLVSQVSTAELDSSLADLNRNLLWAIIAEALLIGGFSGLLTMALIRKNQADLALRQANEQLEQKVLERTEELSEQNSQLEQEIDRRVLTENALAMSEERYRAIMESMDDDVYVTSGDYKMIYANPNLERRLFDDRSSCYTALYNRQSPCPWCIVSSVLSGQKVTYEMKSPEDDKIYHISNTPINYHEDKLGKLTIARDISEIRKTQQALATSELRYSTLLENMREGVVVIDPEGIITYCNSRLVQMLGHSLGEIIGSRYGAFLDGNNCEILKKQLILRKSNVTESYELIWQQKSGKQLLTLISPAILRNDNGEFAGSFGLVTDITEQRAAEEEKRSLGNQLQQAQKMEALGTLAGGIAHDFNNILSAILGYAELIKGRTEEGSEIHLDLKEIIVAGRRATKLVRQILAFSRQTGEIQKPLAIVPIVEEALKLIRAAMSSSISIDLTIAKDIGMVMADPTQIHQIIMNLCTNSCHAMGQNGGRLQISIERVPFTLEQAQRLQLLPGDFVRVVVQDTGSGIQKEQLEKIFEPFFTTKEVGKGTGLGLSVVHSIIQDLAGIIRVESSVGEGSLFEILLPITHKDSDQAEIVVDNLQYGQGEHVIWVDDEKTLVTLGCQILDSLNYKAHGFSDPRKCLAAIREQPKMFRLVISDFNMPKMNGLQLVEQIHNLNPGMPVILCSGYSESINCDNSRDHGVNLFLMKPVRKFDIATAISKVL